MNLRDRLTRIFPEPAQAPRNGLALRLQKLRPAGADHRLAQLVGGVWQQLEPGRYLSVTRDYPLSYRHGEIGIDEVFTIDAEMLALLSGLDAFGQFDPTRALFIDTETTGLAGGAGTYVFLVGLGYFVDGAFRLHQLFLPDLESEKALLEDLGRIAAPGASAFQYLISFNGKSYDLNLLENRFILQRLNSPFGRLSHLDLLYPSRTLWKGTLESCSLQTLERKLLGVYRQNDIHSALIPRLYFNYLRTGECHEFPRIFEHNRIDLLSLLTLMSLASRLAGEPDRGFFMDPVAAARLCLRRGNPARAAALLESACQKEAWSSTRAALLLELATLKKRLGRTEEALALCLEIIQSEPLPSLRAYEESAKILEHEQHDLEAAYRLVTEAAQIYPDSQELRHRLHRLHCRLAGKKWY